MSETLNTEIRHNIAIYEISELEKDKSLYVLKDMWNLRKKKKDKHIGRGKKKGKEERGKEAISDS